MARKIPKQNMAGSGARYALCAVIIGLGLLFAAYSHLFGSAHENRSVFLHDRSPVTQVTTSVAPLASVNAIFPTHSSHPHHVVYDETSPFKPWNGTVTVTEGVITDFVGAHWKTVNFCNPTYMVQGVPHAIRVWLCKQQQWLVFLHKQCDKPIQGVNNRTIPPLSNCSNSSRVAVQRQWPAVSEEYFEYIDVLTSVLEYTTFFRSRGPYVFVEIGAGYGHWAITSAVALRQIAPLANYKLKMLEIDTAKLPLIEQHIQLNKLSSAGKNSILVERKGVSSSAGRGKMDGKAFDYAAKMQVQNATQSEAKGAVFFPTVTVADALSEFDRVDMVDIDIQGAEAEIFTDEAMKTLATKTTRVHIGLHAQVDANLIIDKFKTHGFVEQWIFMHTPTNYVRCNEMFHYSPTPFGPVCFADGVLSFVNSRFSHISVHGRSAYIKAFASVSRSGS